MKVSIRQLSTGNYWSGSSFSSGTENLITASNPAGTWTLTFPASNFPAGGTYTVRAFATDHAGNVGAGTSNTFNVDYDPNAVIFVNPAAANDTGNGQTPATADKTINGGLADAITGRTTILVALGAHAGVSTTPSVAVTVRGGYDATSWLRSAPPIVANAQNTSLASVVTGPGGSDTTGYVANAYTVTIQQLTINSGTPGVASASAYGVRATGGANVTLQRSVVVSAAGGAGTAGTNATANNGNGSNGNGGQGPAGNGNSNRTGGTGGGGISSRNGGKGGDGGAQGNNAGGAGIQGTVQSAGQGGTGGGGGNGISETFCCTDAGAGGGGNGGAGGAAERGRQRRDQPRTGGRYCNLPGRQRRYRRWRRR